MAVDPAFTGFHQHERAAKGHRFLCITLGPELQADLLRYRMRGLGGARPAQRVRTRGLQSQYLFERMPDETDTRHRRSYPGRTRPP